MREFRESSMAQATKRDGSITYTAVLTPGEDGWVCAQIAEVPEAISQGRTLEEAKANVVDALELALQWRREEGEPLPERAEVTVATVTVPAS
jgi:predicted RNase H-like HicB family nuclease